MKPKNTRVNMSTNQISSKFCEMLGKNITYKEISAQRLDGGTAMWRRIRAIPFISMNDAERNERIAMQIIVPKCEVTPEQK